MTDEALVDPFDLCGHTIEGKYRVASVVGDGGFGVVYRAVHKGFGELIAVKCLKVSGEQSAEQRDRFLAQLREEGRLLLKLSRATPSIVQALDVGAFVSPKGVWIPYLVLEWLEGKPLSDVLAARALAGRGGVGVLDAARLVEPIAKALAVAHEHKVAHRDVKPGNVFVAEVGGRKTLKLLDFGIAKVLTEHPSFTAALAATSGGPSAFTPRYGAPEQFNKQRGATGPWTDVFALALLFLELATGEHALLGDDPTQLYIASSDPHLRPTLARKGVDAPAVDAVLAKALSIEPRARHANAKLFWDELAAAVGERAISSGSPELLDVAASPTIVESRAPHSSTRPFESAPSPSGEAPSRAAVAPVPLAEPAGARRPKRRIDRDDPMAETPAPKGPAARPAPGPPGSPPALIPPPPRRETSSPTSHEGAKRPLWPWLLGATAVGGGAIAYLASLGLVGPRPKPDPTATATATAPRPTGSVTLVPPPSATSSAKPAPPTPPSDMVYVAPGSLSITDPEGRRELVLTKGFFLDRTEVTVAAYSTCVERRACAAANTITEPPLPTPSADAGDEPVVDLEELKTVWAERCTARAGSPGHPINCVDWKSAGDFCRSAKRRLPTEGEWEFAARSSLGGRGTPWRGESTCESACLDRNSSCVTQGGAGSCVAGAHASDKVGPGLLDLVGNLAEWVDDGYQASAPRGIDPRARADRSYVVRGAHFLTPLGDASVGARQGAPASAALVTVGFRCAADVPSP